MESIIVLKAGNTALKLTFCKKLKQDGLNFPNFNTTKKSASTKRWMMLCFLSQERHIKKVCHKNLSQFVPKCRLVFLSPKIQPDESFPARAEVCGKVALHSSNAKAIRSTWFGRHVRRG